MLKHAGGSEAIALRRVRAGWIAVPAIVIAFFLLSLVPGQWALVVRQAVFLVSPMIAVVAFAAIVRVASSGAERRLWTFLTLCVVGLFVGELYFSAYQVFVSPTGPPVPSLFDVFNLFAAAWLVCALVVALGLDRLPKLTLSVLTADIVAVCAVVYVGIYAFWMGRLGQPDTPWHTGALWAAISLLGVVILAGIAWVARWARSGRDRPTMSLLGVSITVFALQLATWPLREVGVAGAGVSAADALDGSIVALGYGLLMMAGLTRLSRSREGWRFEMGCPIDIDRMWQISILGTAVLVASAASWALRPAASSGERGLYVAATSIAVIALVVRTSFATLETGALRRTSATDSVTGALNYRSFQEECDKRILVGRRRGTPLALAVLGLDGFARVNHLFGHAVGDESLRTVASVLESAAGESAQVFRLSGAGFAVLGSGVSEAEAERFGLGLLGAVKTVEPGPGVRLSASIGVAATDSCLESKEELLRRAVAAKVWAEYHGKGRVVSYDEHIVHALGTEERLRLEEEHAHVGVVRALAAAADARDASNVYHSRNVAALAMLLAEKLGIDPHRAREIEIAAILHDVGRIAMPDSVTIPVVSSWRESRADEQHAALGAQLVASLGIDELPSWVRAHHERWDGAGFPDGLAGHEIPLEARMIALADAYDRMTGGRRGRPPMSKGVAMHEIDHGIGTRFDPVLAETFIEVVGQIALLGWSDNWPAA